MPKKWKLNIINGTIHTGLSEILSDSYACGKRQIFTKDFTKEWVLYAISLANITIAKESLFGIAIAKITVNGPLPGLAVTDISWEMVYSKQQKNNVHLSR